uniref:Uncharacterized protein n=1 Tax=Morchella importuna TaxID=1174673 RepID=A0A650AF52_9PEZI|nr:hypothetical protein [Morchella importuna]QGN66656.1 hypothetical protein [Morchella importuna]
MRPPSEKRVQAVPGKQEQVLELAGGWTIILEPAGEPAGRPCMQPACRGAAGKKKNIILFFLTGVRRIWGGDRDKEGTGEENKHSQPGENAWLHAWWRSRPDATACRPGPRLYF